MLSNSYSTSMKKKLDQLQEFDSRIQSDHQMFMALFQRHLFPSSSEASPNVEAPDNQTPAPRLPAAPLSNEAPRDRL